MLNKSIKFLIETKLAAVLLLVLFVGWGIVNAPFNWDTEYLPSNPVAVDAIPDIGENQQIVYTNWDGRSPQDIENQITYPLTSALLGIPGVKTIRSTSMFGFSSIYIIFNEDVEFYWSRSRILEKLNALPKDLLPNDVSPALGPDATSLGQIYWYTLEGRDKDGKVTGGWDLQELRSIQDFYVKNALASSNGVSEVASIGGHVLEYQIDVDPELMRQYGLSLDQVVQAVKTNNKDVGAQTIEINQAEYLIRGLGYVQTIADLEDAVVSAKDYVSIRIKDIAKVVEGPANRRGILDKEGAEVVGGVVVARYGANPMEVIQNVKEKINDLSAGLPSKILEDGSTSQLTIVPFYDRTELIEETLNTLNDALILEILITIFVIVVMVFNLRASILISGLLPIAVLMVFVGMKYFEVDANIVALSGIAIAIGTMVDVGIILSENIIRHLDEHEGKLGINTIVYNATKEVSGAIVTAVSTTIISFIPVFTMIGAEGKLFRPLAFTKTMALGASIAVALFFIPPFAAYIFKKRKIRHRVRLLSHLILGFLGLVVLVSGYVLGLSILAFALSGVLLQLQKVTPSRSKLINVGIACATIIVLLADYWRPLGFDRSIGINLIFVAIVCFGLLAVFWLFHKKYVSLLTWALNNKILFLSVPTALVVCGLLIMRQSGKEFMPSLNEGSFLLMPTSMPHAGSEENKRVLQQLDMAVANLPEIASVVGKAGRTESALDPAPLSMYENVIIYKPEYARNESGLPQRYKVNEDGVFMLKDGGYMINPNLKVKNHDQYIGKTHSSDFDISTSLLIEDKDGEYYRNWRPEIKSTNDIWDEIVKVSKLPGVTTAPKLQPIETRLVMLQTGMRAPMGIKVKGPDLETIEQVVLQLERLLKQAPKVNPATVIADRTVGKPYMEIEIDREAIARYGIRLGEVQEVIEVGIGGKRISTTVEGRERYPVRVRYMRELRDQLESLGRILVPAPDGSQIPLEQLAHINYRRGPQNIKSEDTFLLGYVLFDKQPGFAEVEVVESAQNFLKQQIENGQLVLPPGVSYAFAGSYENQVRSEQKLRLVLPLALFAIFIILYLQFKSTATTLMVFSGILVAWAGGFLMLWLYGQDWFLNVSLLGVPIRELFQMHTYHLSVAVWVGFLALFGIASDDGVIMATYLDQSFEKNKPGTIADIRKATVEAGKRRVRPCLMTLATTVLALIPVLTSTGRGSEIMVPMAIPTFGGMSVVVITMFVVPVLYAAVKEFEIRHKLDARFAGVLSVVSLFVLPILSGVIFGKESK